jgi:hypothetical protein
VTTEAARAREAARLATIALHSNLPGRYADGRAQWYDAKAAERQASR